MNLLAFFARVVVGRVALEAADSRRRIALFRMRNIWACPAFLVGFS
jgi:hypothetical protein